MTCEICERRRRRELAPLIFSLTFGVKLPRVVISMKTQPSAPRAVSAVMLAAAMTLALTSCWPRQEHFQDLPGLLSAIRSYSRDLATRGQPVPANVSMSELVNRGYLSSNSVRAFQGMDTRIWFTASPSVPDSVLISARLSDGSVNAALADGSVQQFSAQAFAQHLEKTGQSGAANGSRPSGARTNSPSGPDR